MTERICGVACRFGDLVTQLPAPNRHSDMIRVLAKHGWDLLVSGEQGFYTNERNFINRREAVSVASIANQWVHNMRTLPPCVFSEDLW